MESFAEFQDRLYREQRANPRPPTVRAPVLKAGPPLPPIVREKPVKPVKRGKVVWHSLFRARPPQPAVEAPRILPPIPPFLTLRDVLQRERRRKRIMRQKAKDCRTLQGIEYLASDPCAYCNSPNPTTHDHIEPVSKGGSHGLDNLVRCCWACNRAKGTQPLLRFLGKRAQKCFPVFFDT